MKKTKPKIYTEEWVEKELESIYKEITETKQYIWLGQVFINKEYSRKRFSEWDREFSDKNERIRTLIEKIREYFEVQLVFNGLTKRFDSSLTKFCLVNNHGWTDKPVHESREERPVLVIGKADIKDDIGVNPN